MALAEDLVAAAEEGEDVDTGVNVHVRPIVSGPEGGDDTGGGPGGGEDARGGPRSGDEVGSVPRSGDDAGSGAAVDEDHQVGGAGFR
jgi:hypothetical protein